MSSNGTSYSRPPPSECEIYSFLGGTLDETTKEAYAVLVFLIVLAIISSPATTFLNVLVIIAVRTKPRLKTMSNIALACLAVTDCLMGVIGLPIFIVARIFTLLAETSSDFCTPSRLSRNSLRILGGSTVLHLVLMNVERYLAIKHSFHYTTIVTNARILGSSAFTWLITLCLTVPLVILDEDIYLIVNNVLLFLCIAIVIFCQVTVYLEIRRHQWQIAAQQVSEGASKNFLKEKKAFLLITIVLLTEVVTYAPIFFVRIFLTNTVKRSKNTAHIAFFVSTFVVILNSLINPTVYCVRTEQFREAFVEILFRNSNGQAEENKVENCWSTVRTPPENWSSKNDKRDNSKQQHEQHEHEQKQQ